MLLEIIHKSICIIKNLLPELLSLESCLMAIKVLMKVFDRLMDLQFLVKENSNDRYRYLHLESLCYLMKNLWSFCSIGEFGKYYSMSESGTQIISTLMQEGLSSKLAQIIMYILNFDTMFKHTLVCPFGEESILIVEMHKSILHMIQTAVNGEIDQ